MRVWPRLLLLLSLTLSCGDDDGVTPPTPDAGVAPGFNGVDDFCPGSPHCTGAGGDGKLSVGAGKAIYTPAIPEPWTDTNLDGEYDTGEPFTDTDGDGKFDALFLFGGVPAGGVETDIEARAIAFSQHDTIVVVCYLDTIGMLADDFDLIRADAQLAGLDIDHIVLASTHAHSTPDTVGISNQNPLVTGYNQDYVATVRSAAASAIKDAVLDLRPAQLRITSFANTDILGDPTSGTDEFAKDIRDPVIYDPTVTIARFTEEGTGNPITTLVAWADHPEVALYNDSPENLRITAHYVHYLRQIVEDGVPMTQSGLGGITVYINGAVGGQLGTLRGTAPIGLDGVQVTQVSHEMDKALGESLGLRALQALEQSGVDVTTGLDLSYRTTEYHARLDNTAFQAMFLIGVLAPHRFLGYDEDKPIGPGNEPWLPVRATYVQVGPIGIVTSPGELHPETWVGGFDGSWSWGNPILNPMITENVPDLAMAPAGPYLRDLVLMNSGVEYPILAGMANDYLGYIVPAYNYALSENNPYLEEAAGDHYEEVYSLGPDCEDHLMAPVLELVKARP